MKKITIKKFQRLSLLLLSFISYLGLGTANAQIGIGTTSPDASAQLELQSTAKGFLPPRMDTDARDGIGSPAEGLTIYNTDNKCLEFFTSDNDWISACDGSVVTSPPPPPSTVIGENNVEWMDRNLGANQVATSSTDAASYGDLYQWGRAADGHEKILRVTGDVSTSDKYTNVETASAGVANFNSPGGAWDGKFITTSSTSIDRNWVDLSVPGVDDLWQGVNGVNNPCPSGYRIPTEAEWEAERSSWDSYNPGGAITSPLKLPMAGSRNRSNGSLNNVGTDGRYWSSTVSSTSSRYLFFGSSDAFMYADYRALGFSVRCLKD